MRPRVVGRTHLAVLLVYALLAVLLTWPTATHLATHLPGDGGDDPAIAWNLWWVKHALLVERTNPLFSDYMFYPVGVNLAFYTLTVLNALTAMPLTLALGVVAASNLHVGFTIVAGGYGAFLLARHGLATSARSNDFRYARAPGVSIGAAAMAGGFYALASSQLFYISLGQFNIASSHWVPYAILFILKSRADLPALRWPCLAALFLVMQAWSEMTYASFLLIFIALYAVYEAGTSVKSRISNIQERTARSSVGIASREARISSLQSPIAALKLALRNLLLLTVLFILGISPLLAAMLPDMRAEGDFWVQGSGFAEVFSADLAGFLVPGMRHPVWEGLVERTGIAHYDKGQHIYLGFTLLILAAAGIVASWRRPATRPWLWLIAALLFAWLALGPSLYINGSDTGIPGPFVLLQSLPFFKGNRYPSRYSVMLVLSLSMLAALGLGHILRGLAGRRFVPAAVGGLLAALFLFEHLAVPLPQSDMRVPAPYHALAAEPGDWTLLDIPLAWRNGFRITGPIHPGFMFGQFYQTVHARRLLQGNTSRNPEFKFQYFTQAPIINSLLALETGHSLPVERYPADRAVAGAVLRFFDIRYIVVRPGPGDDPSVTPEATAPYIEAVMPVRPVHRDPALTLYRVELPPLPQQVEISPGEALARLYLGEGWGALVDRRAAPGGQWLWAQRRRMRLWVPLAGGPQAVKLRLFAPGEGQRLTIRINGWSSPPLALRPGWAEYTFNLPAQAVQAGLNEVYLDFDRLYPLAELFGPAGVLNSLYPPGAGNPAILAQSAGEEVGDLAHIYVNGVDVSPNQRGYNVVVISPQGQAQAAAFDTHLDPGASAALARFIAAVPAGSMVAVAAADEASLSLGEEAIAALRSLGATGDLRGKFRWSHALIGVKGGEPGSAWEALDGLRPVSVAVGPPLTEPNLAVAVEWIRFKAAE